MKRSHFLLSLAVLAVAAFVSARDSVFEAVGHTWRACRDWAVKIAMVPIAMMAEQANFIARKPTVLLIAARSFFARCVRRAQPRIESQWRLCASA